MQKWVGWVESKLRQLVQKLEGFTHVIVTPWPYHIHNPTPENPFCDLFFMGLDFQEIPKSEGKRSIDLSPAVSHFKWLVCDTYGGGKKDGMGIELKHVRAPDLPEIVFKDSRRPEKRKKKTKRKDKDDSAKTEVGSDQASSSSESLPLPNGIGKRKEFNDRVTTSKKQRQRDSVSPLNESPEILTMSDTKIDETVKSTGASDAVENGAKKPSSSSTSSIPFLFKTRQSATAPAASPDPRSTES